MSKSVADVNREQKERFGTLSNKFSDFKVGDGVRIICVCQDFRFFNGTETGTVTEEASKTSSGYILVAVNDNKKDIFNFRPEDLMHIDKRCPECRQIIKECRVDER